MAIGRGCPAFCWRISKIEHSTGTIQLINNRQAGRRRGRNNPRQNSNGGGNRGSGDSGNRIDNRARGNATQLFEKYRNMARDAQLAGDRVNAEYYLQFADHYFRVLADNRARQEEQQARYRRPDSQDGDDFEGSDESDDGNMDEHDDGYGVVQDDSSFEPRRREEPRPRNPQYDRPERQDRNGNAPRTDRPERSPRDDRGDRTERNDRPERNERSPRDDRPERNDRPVRVDRPERVERNDRPERAPRPERPARAPRPARVESQDEPAFDAAILPPAISRAEPPVEVDSAPDAEAAAAPRRRGRPRRAEAAE
jgi:hypothetical protein